MTENKISINKLVNLTVEGIEDQKGKQITVLDLRKLDGAVCDYFVICNGTSSTHVNAIVNAVQKKVSKAIHEKPWHVEGADNGEWVLIDYVDVVVHVFLKQVREYYDIESLWGDAEMTVIEDN